MLAELGEKSQRILDFVKAVTPKTPPESETQTPALKSDKARKVRLEQPSRDLSEQETSTRQSAGERPLERFSTVRERSPEEEVRRVLAQSQSAHKRVADLMQL